tara:strand:+ start:454 stop:777 length:324 start_codon:yes stop_codon:yes gene_type:complete
MAKKKRSNYGNYLAEFYDGKLSLPHSYWIFGLVYSILVGILLAVLVILFNLPDKTISVLSLPWIIFISIGIWRSSDRYKGSKFWSILAKIAVVLGLIQSIVSILVGV